MFTFAAIIVAFAAVLCAINAVLCIVGAMPGTSHASVEGTLMTLGIACAAASIGLVYCAYQLWRG
jgi:hypothetical protein